MATATREAKMYDYQTAIKEDVKNYIRENYTAEEIRDNLETRVARSGFSEKLYDNLWANDRVTGNASGSYTFSTWEAEENLCHNTGLLEEACDSFCITVGAAFERGAEFCDVIIRCYLLSPAISDALDEIENEIYKLTTEE